MSFFFIRGMSHVIEWKDDILYLVSNPLTLSLEEENELVRSTKKVKDSHNGITEGSPGRCEGSFHANKLSFKEKLMGEITGAYSQSLAFSEQMEAESESNEETEDIRAKGLLRLVF